MTILREQEKINKTKEIKAIFEAEKEYQLEDGFNYEKREQIIKIYHKTCDSFYKATIKNFLHGRRCPNKECILQRRKNTNLLKYGVEHVIQNEEIKDKQKQKLKEIYSSEQLESINDNRKKTCIEKYGVDNPTKSPKIRKKQKDTCKKLYGTEYAIISPAVRKKTLNTFLHKYGVDNPMKAEEVKEKIFDKYQYHSPFEKEEVRRKARQTNIEKYGNEIASKTQIIKNKISNSRRKKSFDDICKKSLDSNIEIMFNFEDWKGYNNTRYDFRCKTCNMQFNSRIDGGHLESYTYMTPICRQCNPKNTSISEKQMQDYVSSYIEIERNRRFSKDGKCYELDIYIPELKVGFEYDGIKWHSEIFGGKNSNYHVDKNKFFRDLGITIYNIREDEWKFKQNLVKSIILSKIGKLENKIYARKTQFKELDNKQLHDFLCENHIQGPCVSSHNYGLFYNNELVSVMTFSKPRFNKKYDYEMVRYCNKTGINVVGSFSKLLSNFNKLCRPNSIISYCDIRFSNGDVYKKNNFRLLNTSKPNYKYFNLKDETTLQSRQKFQKHKLSKKLTNYSSLKTEWENMIDNKFDRIWDCGNYVFLYENKD